MSRSWCSDICAKLRHCAPRRADPRRPGQDAPQGLHGASKTLYVKGSQPCSSPDPQVYSPFGAKLAPVEVVQSRDADLGTRSYMVSAIDRSNECL